MTTSGTPDPRPDDERPPAPLQDQEVLEQWLVEPSPEHLDEAAALAARLGDWPALQRIWLELLQFEGFERHPGAVPAFRLIPEDGRRACPILTWAKAVADGYGQPAEVREEVVRRLVAQDAANLHNHWAEHPDTDAAVIAGTMYLTGQQSLASPGLALTEAWRTRGEIATFIEERRRAGAPPGRLASTIFASKAAQLALMRADLESAVAEAGRAMLTSASGPTAEVAGAIRALSLELLGTRAGRPTPAAKILDTVAIDPSGVGVAWSNPTRLAVAAAALRVLDRDSWERAFAGWEPALGEPLWPVRVYLEGIGGTLWGDPEAALAKLDADVARNVLYSTEQHEPLGQVALRRVRTMLLCHLGAVQTALEQSRRIELPWRWVSLARAELWAGNLAAARQAADEGLFDSATWQTDRLHLVTIRAATAALLKSTSSAEVAILVAKVAARSTSADSLAGIAALPGFARERLLAVHDLAPSEPGCILCNPVMRERIRALAAPVDVLERPVSLTRREQVLLPLLATDRSVPEIAKHLHLSVGTVRKQVASLRAKFDAGSRGELIRRARRTGHLAT